MQDGVGLPRLPFVTLTSIWPSPCYGHREVSTECETIPRQFFVFCFLFFCALKLPLKLD